MEEGGEKKRHLMGRRGWELECRGQDGGQRAAISCSPTKKMIYIWNRFQVMLVIVVLMFFLFVCVLIYLIIVKAEKLTSNITL